MHTSYEQRLEFLHQFLDGAEVFNTKLSYAKIIKGDGWEVSSSGSRFAMLNQAIIQTSRKEALDELLAAMGGMLGPSTSAIADDELDHIFEDYDDEDFEDDLPF